MKKAEIAVFSCLSVAVAAILIFFHASFRLHAFSLAAVALCAVTLAQSILFWSEENIKEESAYSQESAWTAEETLLLNRCFSKAGFFALPLFLLPIFLFAPTIKIIFALVLYCAVFATGRLWFSVQYGKQVKKRLQQEEEEKIEQAKREEYGFYQ